MNIKKIGLTALAGSLVATSAFAGALSVSGSAKLSYTSKSGNEDATVTGSGFGMQENISFTGSGELDNGMNISLLHVMHSDAAGSSTSSITMDMGASGTLRFMEYTSNIGIKAIDDVMPTAEEEVSNGVSGGTAYEAHMGATGFDYTYSMDMGKVVVGYSPGNTSARVDDGGTSGEGANEDSGKSIHVVLDSLADGVTLYAGTGQNGSDDNDTAAIKYAIGAATVGYQWTEIDREAANSGATADSERTQASISYQINDDLAVSYGFIDTEVTGQPLDEEISGFSVGYSMGGMSIKAHSNSMENKGGAASEEYEHTEISVSFAF